jgi:hypothetical protein
MTLDEYNRIQQERSKIDGFGFDVTVTSPCPFCCAPDFNTYKALEVEKQSGKEVVCKSCGRGIMHLMKHDAHGTTIEMVQTRGSDSDLPFLPKMRRVSPPAERPGDPKARATNGIAPGREKASAPGPIMENGQHSSYWVLSEEERAKGFVRPVRRSYIHARGKACGVVTTMSLDIAETYARDPKFYSATFCCGCHEHFPVSEFDWDKGGGELGS